MPAADLSGAITEPDPQELEAVRGASFRELADTSPAVLWTTDAANRRTFASRRWWELTGQPGAESLGMGWLKVVHPEDRDRSKRAYVEAAAKREPFQLEFRLKTRGGTYRWALDAGRPRLGPAGELLGYVGSVMDIDDRKRSEELARRTGETFYGLIQNSPFGVYVVDADFRLVQVSEGAKKVFSGVSPCLGRDFAEVLRTVWPEPFATEAIGLFRRTLDTGEPYHAVNTTERRRDIAEVESYDWKIERITMPDGRFGVVCHFYDLSERQRYESALAESEQRLRLLADAVPALVARLDDSLTYRFVNRAYAEWFGVSPVDVVGRTAREIMGEEMYGRMAGALAGALAGARAEFEATLPRPRGGPRHVMAACVPDLAEDGRVRGVYLTIHDITARRRTEEALAASEREFRAIFELAAAGKAQADPETMRFVRVNRKFCEITGYDERELLGLSFREITHPEDRATDEVAIARAVRGEADGWRCEKRYIRKDGSAVWVLVVGSLIRDEHGRATRTVATIHDITDRKRAEDALRASEERYRAIVESQAEMVCRFRPDGTILFANGAYAGARRAAPEDLVGANLWDFVSAEDRDLVRSRVESLRPEAPEIRVENRFETVNGVRWTLWTNRALAFDERGRVTEAQSTGIDITDRKRAEEALRESEERFRLVADSAPVLIWMSDPENRGVFFNRRWTEFTGRRLEEELGTGWLEAIHPDDRAQLEECRRALGERRPFTTQFRMRRADGVFRWMRDAGVPRFEAGGAFAGYIGSCVDITERIEAERTVRESEQKLRVVLEAAELGTWVYRLDGHDWALDEKAQHLYGVSSPRLVHDEATVQALLHPDDIPRMWERLRAACDPAGDGRYAVEYRVRRPEGGWRWLATWASVEFEGEGPQRRAVSMIGASRDLTDRIEREQALRQSEARLRQAMQAGRMGSWDWDIASGCVKWSPELERIHGFEPGAFGGTIEDIRREMHPEDRGRVEAAIAAALAGTAEYHVEYRIGLSGGGTRWVEGRGSVFRDEEGRPVRMAGVCADVTERKETEAALQRYQEHLEQLVRERTEELERSHQQLRFSERMASLGTLSMGIGHDLGNLLLPIRARVDVLRSRPLEADVREAIEAIGECAEYLQSLARGLRLFAQDPENLNASGASTELVDWCRDTERFFRRSLPKHVQLDVHIPCGLPPVSIPPHRLTQAVVNLITNAGDAIGSGEGRVRLEARAVPEGVCLTVSDDGPGMSEEVRQRCLEPFYTTKVRGARTGTGLGLSMVHGIITAAGGAISVSSGPGQGSTFALVLPAAAAPPEEADTSAEPAVVSIGDPRIRSLVLAVLGTLGYEPTADGDPAEAAVWITDPLPESLARARALRPGAPRGLVVLGELSDGWREVGAVPLSGTLNPMAIRRAVREHGRGESGT